MKLAIFGKRRQTAEDLKKVSDLLAYLSERGVFTAVDSRFYEVLDAAFPGTVQADDVFQGRDFTADFAFSIGGDGTFLATARAVAEKEIPIAGFNTGTLGFLAEESLSEAPQMVCRLLQGEYEVEDRGLIEVQALSSDLHFRDWPVALNEVTVMRHDFDAMLTVNARLDGMELARVRGDGLVVATPTGSTAYNLSCGGPIVAPTAPCRILSPIAPHSLTMRPLVFSDSCEIELSVNVRGSSYRLAIDGRGITVPSSTVLRLRKPSFVTRVLHRPGHNFVETLRQKLLWGQNNA